MAKERAADAKDERLMKEAHKRATFLFAKEKEKTAKAAKDKTLKKGKTAAEVKRIVELEFGEGKAPSARTIQEHVAKGSVGSLLFAKVTQGRSWKEHSAYWSTLSNHSSG